MIDMWGRCIDDLKKCSHKLKTVINKAKGRRCLAFCLSMQHIENRNLTYLKPLHGNSQCIHCFPCGSKDTQDFQPEQELLS